MITFYMPVEAGITSPYDWASLMIHRIRKAWHEHPFDASGYVPKLRYRFQLDRPGVAFYILEGE